MKMDTAHQAWNKSWATPEGRAGWLVAEESVVRAAEQARVPGTPQRALDIGCGVGRHALQLARLGYDTAAVDLAEAGLAEVGRMAQAEDLSVSTHAAPMTALPFGDGTFDFAVAFNVIYHGDDAIVRATVNEIRRVLKPGGIYYGTMISKRTLENVGSQEISRNTFMREGDTEDDKHPHYYSNAKDIVDIFDGFRLRSLEERAHRKPGFWHWHVVVQKPDTL
ncbi:class I SAM-dependent methyltransferase [Microbacteriaceae bacterium K1510]|nr:class I SAM-dependent methyltransferase [Microbacteriaceae bacterium K1510]